jgi:hypothetical protein
MNLFSAGGNNVTIDFVRGTMATIGINGNASAEIDCLDGDWVNTVLREDGGNLQIVAEKASYGKIVATVSASATGFSFPNTGSVVLGGIDTCKSIKDAKKYSKCKKDRGVVSGSHYSSTPIITPYEAWGDPWHKGVLPMISGFYINKKALISNQQEFVVIVLIDEEDAKMIKDVKSSINWKKPNIQ